LAVIWPSAKTLKPLQTMRPAPDPLAEHEPTGNHEQDSAAELSAVEKAFREGRKREQERMRAIGDSSYYCCLVFDDGDQCSAFIKALDLGIHGDMFLDGRAVAQKLGIVLPESKMLLVAPAFRIDKRLAKMAKPLNGH
jgi:hypothetical protein